MKFDINTPFTAMDIKKERKRLKKLRPTIITQTVLGTLGLCASIIFLIFVVTLLLFLFANLNFLSTVEAAAFATLFLGALPSVFILSDNATSLWIKSHDRQKSHLDEVNPFFGLQHYMRPMSELSLTEIDQITAANLCAKCRGSNSKKITQYLQSVGAQNRALTQYEAVCLIEYHFESKKDNAMHPMQKLIQATK